MDMQLLQSIAGHAMWHDGERSRNEYHLPLRRFPFLDGFLAASWISLAQRRGLLHDIPDRGRSRGLPFPIQESPESHIGPFLHAIDFLVPDGTSVLAALGGTVTEVVQSHAGWGPHASYAEQCNYLTVLHPGGECTQYCHLGRGSVTKAGIRVGDTVRPHQRIAMVGKSGWTDRDHLHFLVFRGDRHSDNPFGFKSLVPRFRR